MPNSELLELLCDPLLSAAEAEWWVTLRREARLPLTADREPDDPPPADQDAADGEPEEEGQ